MVVPIPSFSRALSPLVILRDLFTHQEPATKYERISQGTTESPVDSSLEDGLLPGDGQQHIAKRQHYIKKFQLPAFCVVMFATVTVLYVIAKVPQDRPSNEISLSPIRICFKDHSVTNGDMKCDIPLKIVPDEASAQVVIWSSPSLNLSEYDGEKLRTEKPGQLHGFWSLENAGYYPQVREAREKLAAADPSAFDFEVTYKTSSDFPIPYAYGFMDPRKAALPFEARRQDKIAAAFISNCSPLNDRTEILKKLIDLLPDQIDSFGGCLQNADSDQVVQHLNLNPSVPGQPHHNLSRWEEKMSIIGRYKFTIAFENTNEEDYVTEKYYQALSAGSIPIHLGLTTAQFRKFKPSPDSALNVADFKTVEELADRIKKIANDRALFEAALEWKNQPFPERFDEIIGWGKVHEACRIAKFLRKKWRNPHALKQERYESFYQRLNLTTPWA